jgi:hypothetical protein
MTVFNVDASLYSHNAKSHDYQVEVHSTPAQESHLTLLLHKPWFFLSAEPCLTKKLSTHSEHYLDASVPSEKAQHGAITAVGIVVELAEALGAKIVKLNASESRATAVLIIPDSATSDPEEGHLPLTPVARPPDESDKVTHVVSPCVLLGDGRVMLIGDDGKVLKRRVSPTHEPAAKRGAHD